MSFIRRELALKQGAVKKLQEALREPERKTTKAFGKSEWSMSCRAQAEAQGASS